MCSYFLDMFDYLFYFGLMVVIQIDFMGVGSCIFYEGIDILVDEFVGLVVEDLFYSWIGGQDFFCIIDGNDGVECIVDYCL